MTYTIANVYKNSPNDWMLYAIYFKGSALRYQFGDKFKSNESCQLLHMNKVRTGRKVFYRATFLAQSGIQTVDMKGSWNWNTYFSDALGGHPYYMANVFDVDIFLVGDTVLYKKNQAAYHVRRVWYEDHRQWFYDLKAVDEIQEPFRIYDVPLVDIDDFTYGSIAA